LQWEFDNDRSIATQIVELIQRGILSGYYPPGSSMPSVRVLALAAGVNPNTMQKALTELERQGLLRTQRTSGRTVTTDESLILALKSRTADSYVRQFLAGMQNMGIEREQAVQLLLAAEIPAAEFPTLPQPETFGTSEVNA